MGAKVCCDTREANSADELNETVQEKIQKFQQKHPHIKKVIQQKNQMPMINNRDLDTHYFENGTFLGKLVEKKKNSFGIMLYDNGMYYEGEWKDNMFYGQGIFIYTNGDFYLGNWENCLPHGNGLYVKNDPVWRYDGQWDRGVQTGKGKETFQDSSNYEGQFQKGLRHGKGKYRNHDGRVYEGSFVNGEVQGSAKACDFHFLYEGEWKKGKPEGAGKSIWQKDKKLEAQYIGQYKDGKKNGFGEYRHKNGVTYKGRWDDGYITNVGIIIQTPSKKYDRNMKESSLQ